MIINLKETVIRKPKFSIILALLLKFNDATQSVEDKLFAHGRPSTPGPIWFNCLVSGLR